MQIKPLYRFKRANGGITVSPHKPECEYTEEVRLIADEGKALTNGKVITPCVDTDSVYGWTEIDAPPDEDEPTEPTEPTEPEPEPDDTTTYAELAQVYKEGVNGLE